MSLSLGRGFLGRTGIEVSDFCLGTDYYGSRTPPNVAWQLMDAFAEAGGTFIDTANIYAAFIPGFVGGESESVIGAWMAARGNRDDIVVATKVAGPYQDVPGGLRARDVASECEKSLRRLQTSTIDVYYAHIDDRATPLEEIIDGFGQLLRSGKIRSVGLSNWQLWRLAEARLLAETDGWPLAALEYRHTYLRPTAAADFAPQIVATPELFAFARAHELRCRGLLGAAERGIHAPGPIDSVGLPRVGHRGTADLSPRDRRRARGAHQPGRPRLAAEHTRLHGDTDHRGQPARAGPGEPRGGSHPAVPRPA